jgi:TetR/AcrR family transcriptional repressor of mexJK operon
MSPRQTLYNHFPSKAELFGEVIRQVTAALLITLDGKAEGLRERLLRFGIAFREKALSAEGLGFYRALVAETTRFPDLAPASTEPDRPDRGTPARSTSGSHGRRGTVPDRP